MRCSRRCPVPRIRRHVSPCRCASPAARRKRDVDSGCALAEIGGDPGAASRGSTCGLWEQPCPEQPPRHQSGQRRCHGGVRRREYRTLQPNDAVFSPPPLRTHWVCSWPADRCRRPGVGGRASVALSPRLSDAALARSVRVFPAVTIEGTFTVGVEDMRSPPVEGTPEPSIWTGCCPHAAPRWHADERSVFLSRLWLWTLRSGCGSGDTRHRC